MKSPRRLGPLAFAILVAASTWAAPSPDDAARAAAEAWLRLHDAGNDAAAWDQSAKFFKESVTRERWISGSAAFQPYLGKVLSRKLKSLEHVDLLPPFPPGKHVVIEFDTQFERKGAMAEVLVLMPEADGVWRVVAYR